MCLVFEHQRRSWGGENYYINGFFFPTAQVPWYKLPFSWHSSHGSIGDFAWIEMGREWRYDCPFEVKPFPHGKEVGWGKKEGWGFFVIFYNRKWRKEIKNERSS